MKLYVGNLNFRTTQESLEGLFSNYGEVQEVAIITDRETGRPRGFAFVTMNDEGGKEAIEALNGQEFEGRTLNINEARPREPRGGVGGGSGRVLFSDVLEIQVLPPVAPVAPPPPAPRPAPSAAQPVPEQGSSASPSRAPQS